MRIRLVIGLMDTRTNNEDFALTPYLFTAYSKKEVYGLGLCWGYFAFYVGTGYNVPDKYPLFRYIKYNKKD